MTLYESLSAEYYDLSFPFALADEINFYRQFINPQNHTLEAMSGNGRVLLPMIQAGFNIEGVDNSTAMINICHNKAKKSQLDIVVHQADITYMQLGKQYQNIIVSIGSFLLIHPREKALLTLQNLKAHLVPDGKLFIDTYIYWTTKPYEKKYVKKIATQSNDYIKCISQKKFNKIEQYYVAFNQFERIKSGKIIQREEEYMHLQWYYKYEFKLLLEKAGFHSIRMHPSDFDLNAGGIFYEAVNAA